MKLEFDSTVPNIDIKITPEEESELQVYEGKSFLFFQQLLIAYISFNEIASVNTSAGADKLCLLKFTKDILDGYAKH